MVEKLMYGFVDELKQRARDPKDVKRLQDELLAERQKAEALEATLKAVQQSMN